MSDALLHADDPVWPGVVCGRLMPLVPVLRQFWADYAEYGYSSTGVAQTSIPGLYIRCTKSGAKSPVKGVQVFPYCTARFLNITRVAGGVPNLLESLCPFELEEFTVLFRNNLPATGQRAPVLCFVPTSIAEGAQEAGAWVYLRKEDIRALLGGSPRARLREKLMLRLQEK